MIMALVLRTHSRPHESLFLVQDRQQSEDQGNARIQLHAHEALGNAIGNVFKVHGFALDETADGDDGIEGGGGAGRGGLGGEGGEIGGGAAEEVAGGEGGGLRGLDLGG